MERQSPGSEGNEAGDHRSLERRFVARRSGPRLTEGGPANILNRVQHKGSIFPTQ